MALAVYDTARIGNKQAEALNGRAPAARARGDLPAAIQFGEESLQRIEALRAGVSAPELRAFYSAAHSDYYESQVETLLAAHRETGQASDYLTASLSVSERARARMIVDLLNEAAVPLDRSSCPKQRSSASASCTTSSVRSVISATACSRRRTPKPRSSSPSCVA